MTDLLTQIANAEMILTFLKSQLPKEEVAEKPKKVTKKKEEVVEKKEEKPKKETKKNIPRLIKSVKDSFTKVLKTYNEDVTDELLEEFKNYENEITADDYMKSALDVHAKNFADSKFKKPEEKVEDVPLPVKVVKKSEYVGQANPPDLAARSNAAPPLDLHSMMKILPADKLKALQKTDILKPIGNGNYWYAKEGVYVFMDTEEDLEEKEYNGKKYFVYKSNKRVYELDEKTDRDVFVGFAGVGEFCDLVV